MSSSWNAARGAATWIDASTGLTGEISSLNSLVGASSNDRVGSGSISSGITVLTNGNYVVLSPTWKNSSGFGVGAATLCPGNGLTGVVSTQNSLIGSAAGDFASSTITPLANGNYVIGLPQFTANGVLNAGAATLVNGVSGRIGVVSPVDSFVGNTINGSVAGCGVTALTNGNYVICTVNWNSSRGAATWGNGTSGVVGTP